MQGKFKRLLATLAVVLFGIGGGLVASPAQAAYADCNSGNICLWDAINAGGSPWQWSVGYIRQQPGDCLVLTASASNIASSLRINGMLSTTRVVFFDLAGGGDSRAVTGVSHYYDADLRYTPGMSGFSNKISSICLF